MTVRTSSISLYSDIAREHLAKLIAIEAEISALKSAASASPSPDEHSAFESNITSLEIVLAKHASIVIVFAAVTVEAHIYDYAARRLSDKYTQAYLDKLDTVSKWMVIPRLITGKSLPENGKWLALMRGLIKERNLIVHSKTHEPPFDHEDKNAFYKKLIEGNSLIPQKARQAIELLDLLPDEISKLDPEETLWLQVHLK